MNYLSPAYPNTMFMCCLDDAPVFPHLVPESREHGSRLTQPNTPTGGSHRGHHDHPHVCIAHGCDALLEKAYDKKCRTCQRHRQADTLNFNGMPHRFCQKCSRFHPIEEFDGVKRNCRQRLYEHNYRQRRLRMLRKVAQQTPASPVYTPVCENTGFCGGNGSFHAPGTPTFMPQYPVPDLARDVDFAGANIDPALLDEFDIDEILNSDLLNTDVSVPQSPVDSAVASTSITAPASPAPMYYQPQPTGNINVPSAPLLAPSPIELDEFLWLEQSMAAPWAPAFNCNYFSGIPVMPQ